MSLKESFKKFKHSKIDRTRIITFFTMVYNFIWSIGKIVFGVFFNTFSFVISGSYTLLLAFAKKIFYKHYDNKDQNFIKRKGVTIGILIVIIGSIFSFYMARLFFVPKVYHYPKIISIMIASFSFTEFGFAIFNTIRANKKKDIMLMNLRSCNLVSSFFALVLTQIALLNLFDSKITSFYNALTGVIFGILAILVGIITILRNFKSEEDKKII